MSADGESINPQHLSEVLDVEVPNWRTEHDWDYGYIHPKTRQFYMIEGAESAGYLYVDYKPMYSAAWLPNSHPFMAEDS